MKSPKVKSASMDDYNPKDVHDKEWFWYEYTLKPVEGFVSPYSDDHPFLGCVRIKEEFEEKNISEKKHYQTCNYFQEISYEEALKKFESSNFWSARLLYSVTKAVQENHKNGYYNQGE